MKCFEGDLITGNASLAIIFQVPPGGLAGMTVHMSPPPMRIAWHVCRNVSSVQFPRCLGEPNQSDLLDISRVSPPHGKLMCTAVFKSTLAKAGPE